eukprot:8175638-Pyramimonas_sp.AAC.1
MHMHTYKEHCSWDNITRSRSKKGRRAAPWRVTRWRCLRWRLSRGRGWRNCARGRRSRRPCV